jgi:hypothetical protein
MNRSLSVLASIVGMISVACGAVASLVPISLLLIILFRLPAGNMIGVSALMVEATAVPFGFLLALVAFILAGWSNFAAKVGLTLTMIGALLTVAIFGWSEKGGSLVIGSLAIVVAFIGWLLWKPRTDRPADG